MHEITRNGNQCVAIYSGNGLDLLILIFFVIYGILLTVVALELSYGMPN